MKYLIVIQHGWDGGASIQSFKPYSDRELALEIEKVKKTDQMYYVIDGTLTETNDPDPI